MAHEFVVLVAFGVEGDTFKDAQEALMQQLVPVLQSRQPNSQVTEWWIAEDERHDGSDCDSAVFVPDGLTQREATILLLTSSGMSFAEALHTVGLDQ